MLGWDIRGYNDPTNGKPVYTYRINDNKVISSKSGLISEPLILLRKLVKCNLAIQTHDDGYPYQFKVQFKHLKHGFEDWIDQLGQISENSWLIIEFWDSS